MKENYKLTIITINLNNKEGLYKTIKSVATQKSPPHNFEYIIIDGGSTDGSIDVINEYADYIDYWVNEPDKGIYNAMNKGVQKAHGVFCLFLNSGDSLYSPNVIREIAKVLNNELDILSGCAYVVKNNQKVKADAPGCLSLPLFFNSGLCHQSTFIKTSLLKKRPYDEQMKISSDWKFFVECYVYEKVRYAKIDMVVALYDGNGISSNNAGIIWEERLSFLDSIPARLLLKEHLVIPHQIVDGINSIPYSYKFHKFLVYVNALLIGVYKKIKPKANIDNVF